MSYNLDFLKAVSKRFPIGGTIGEAIILEVSASNKHYTRVLLQLSNGECRAYAWDVEGGFELDYVLNF